MQKVENRNVLSEEYLLELYNCCFKYDNVCHAVVRYMSLKFLPDRCFQDLHKAVSQFWLKNKMAPTYSLLKQRMSANEDVTDLIDDIKESNVRVSSEVILEELEEYLRNVRMQEMYKKVGELYGKGEHESAVQEIRKYADWLSSFSLLENSFVDVVDSFESRFLKNRDRHNNPDESRKAISRFYINELDEMNGGRDLRSQLTCFMAATGVGKSHIARHIGRNASMVDGLDVLHFQLEGSESEVLDAYSAALVCKNSYLYETGMIRDREFEELLKSVKSTAGTIKVKSFPRFGNRVTTVDIKNGIAEYRKICGHNPDIVIIDSMDLLNDASGRAWGENGERYKRIAVANDLKDLANDEMVWMVATYQATIENRDWNNNENNVLTEYNCSEAKGLSRPLTHLITLNQSDNERKERVMRLFVAKTRFFAKGDPIKIATDFEHEIFYDVQRTMNLNR